MPTNYNGIPANISGAFPAALTITTTSGANPIVVSFGSPHGLSTGDVVDIQGVTSLDGRNGIWPVTVTGANTFTIPFNGGGFSTSGSGTAQPIKLGVGVYSIPSDGDLDNEASIDNWAKLATGDRTAYLGEALGVQKLAQRTIVGLGGAFPPTAWAQIAAGSLVSGSLYQFTANSETWATRGPITALPIGGGAPTFEIPGICAGDEIRIQIGSNASCDTYGYISWYYTVQPPGVGFPTWPTVYIQATPALPVVPPAVSEFQGMNWLGSSAAAGFSLGNSGNLWLQPIVRANTTGTQSFTLLQDFIMCIDIWRATGMPQ